MYSDLFFTDKNNIKKHINKKWGKTKYLTQQKERRKNT